MRVLHFILDGYHPSNPVKLFDEDIINKEVSDYNHDIITSKTDKSEHLRSPIQWFRYYSRRYVTNESNTNIRITSMYDEVPGEELLWRVLASKGVPSFCMPYNDLASKSAKWLVGDENPELISGIYKKWYSKTSYILDKGKFIRKDTPYIMSAAMAAIARDCMVDDPEVNLLLDKFNKSKSDEELLENFYKMKSALIDYDKNLLHKRLLEGNQYEYNNNVFPNLKKFVSDNSDKDMYVHLGLGETDGIYHHRIYPELINEVVKPYINNILLESIRIVKPDILIISGDHNMTDLDKCHEYEKSYFNKSKNRRKATYVNLGYDFDNTLSLSMNHPLPIFYEHGYIVGGDIYYNSSDRSIEFVNKLRYLVGDEVKGPREDMFPEYLYDTIISKLGE